MKFCFVVWPDVEYQNVVLTRERADNRLVSFYYARQLPSQFLERLVQDGFVLSAETAALAAFFMPSTREKKHVE